MVDPKLIEYIESCRELGMSDTDIKLKLKSTGWQDLQIGEAFTSIGNLIINNLNDIYTNTINPQTSNFAGISGSDMEIKTFLSKKKMFAITGSVFVGILLIIGGVFAYSYFNPILTKYLTLSSLGKINSGHLEGRLVLKPVAGASNKSQENLTELAFLTNGNFDLTKGFNSDLTIKIEVPAGYTSPQVELLSNKDDLYFKLSKFPSPDKPGQPKIQDKWFYFETQAEKNKKSPTADAASKPKSNMSLSDSMSEAKIFKSFQKITDESVSGVNCNQFIFNLDKNNLSDNLITYLDENGTILTTGEKSDLKQYLSQNISSINGDFLIGKKDHTIHRLDLTLNTKDMIVDLALQVSDINKGFTFQQPANAVSYKDTFNIKDQPLPIFSPSSSPMPAI